MTSLDPCDVGLALPKVVTPYIAANADLVGSRSNSVEECDTIVYFILGCLIRLYKPCNIAIQLSIVIINYHYYY